jgi:hypothetical protein
LLENIRHVTDGLFDAHPNLEPLFAKNAKQMAMDAEFPLVIVS